MNLLQYLGLLAAFPIVCSSSISTDSDSLTVSGSPITFTQTGTTTTCANAAGCSASIIVCKTGATVCASGASDIVANGAPASFTFPNIALSTASIPCPANCVLSGLLTRFDTNEVATGSAIIPITASTSGTQTFTLNGFTGVTANGNTYTATVPYTVSCSGTGNDDSDDGTNTADNGNDD